MTNKIKIMIVAAELTAKDSEAALMQTRLAAAPLCNYYETHVIRAAKPSEVIGEAASLQPDVIHFCGNCTAADEFIFADDSGAVTDRCSKSNLLKKLAGVMDEIKLVYFNGTVKDRELAAGGQKIAALIGMEKRGEAEISKKFVMPFYMALGFGNSLGRSFGEVWKTLPEDERKLVLRFRSDIDPNNYCLRSVQVPVRQAADAH